MKNLAVSIVSIVVLNIMFFVWQPYPKHILGFSINDFNLLDVITNIVFFWLFCMVLLVLCNIDFCKNCFRERRFTKVFKIICLLFLSQTVLDILKIVVYEIFPYYFFIVSDICAVISFVFSVNLIIKMTNVDIRKNHNKSITFVLLVLSVIIFVIVEYLNIHDILIFENYAMKYDSSSEMFILFYQNYLFLHQIRSMFVETLCSILFFIWAYNRYQFAKIVGMDSNNRISKKIVKSIVCIFVSVALSVFICYVKCLIIPESSIMRFSTASSVAISHKDSCDLDYSDAQTVIYRRKSYRNRSMVYCNRIIRYTVNNVELYEFETGLYSVNLPMELVYPRNKYTAQGTDFYTLGNQLLIIRKGNEYRFIELEELDEQSYDDDIVKCCEYMIDSGNFSYFEYACDYLLKYDSEFINPYIKRYSKGMFNEDELDNPYNIGINKDYVQRLANKYI